MTSRTWPTGLIELADVVFAYVQEGGGLCVANAGLIVGPESCIVIDALFAPSMTQAFREQIRRVTDKPVRLLVNTPRQAALPFDGELTLHLPVRQAGVDGHTIRLAHLGPAHTIGDAMVLLPEERLVFAGDVAFHYVTPLAFEGHIGGWGGGCDQVGAMG